MLTPLLTYNHLWGVDQEPYRFLPYGALFICVLGVPWLWIAFTRGDAPARASAGAAALLLAATIPTTVAHTRAVDAAGLVPIAPEVTSSYARIADATGGDLTLLDTCFSPEVTRVFGGPNTVQYHTGLAFPAYVDEINGIRASLRTLVLPARRLSRERRHRVVRHAHQLRRHRPRADPRDAGDSGRILPDDRAGRVRAPGRDPVRGLPDRPAESTMADSPTMGPR